MLKVVTTISAALPHVASVMGRWPWHRIQRPQLALASEAYVLVPRDTGRCIYYQTR